MHFFMINRLRLCINNVPLYPHLLSPQFKQVIQPSINTIALVLHLLQSTAFSGKPGLPTRRAGLRIRCALGAQIMPPADSLKANATLPRNECQP